MRLRNGLGQHGMSKKLKDLGCPISGPNLGCCESTSVLAAESTGRVVLP